MSYLMPTLKGILQSHAEVRRIEEAANMVLEAENNLNHIYRTVFDLRGLCNNVSKNERVDILVNHDLVDGILESLFDVEDIKVV